MARSFAADLAAAPAAAQQLRNLRTEQVVARSLEGAFAARARRRGLLGRDRLPAGAGLLIAPCSAIHTVGMRFPIDVIFVSRTGHVRKVVRNLRPWRICLAFRAFAVIELPAGTIAASGTARGDTLRVQHREEPNARDRRELP